LFVAIPSGLGTLHNLLSLSLADNLIDSVVGINLNLGQVLSLNLAQNRLESLCGLERLLAVEKVDLRNNLLEETAEVGRLATLPHISEIWVEGNPFVEIEAGYRVSCFDYFWKEGKTISLDGTVPGFYERHYLTLHPSDQMSSSRPPFATPSPHVIAVDHGHSNTSETVDISSSISISPFIPVDKGHRKRSKRIVNLDTSLHGHTRSRLQFQTRSEDGYDTQAYGAPMLPQIVISEGNTSAIALHNTSPPEYRHHSRRRSEHDETDETPGPLWNLDSSDALNCSAGVNQSYATPDTKANSIASMLGSISELPNGGVDTNSDTYRKKIEGLKKDTGDSWLKIYSQGQENPTSR
jgi:Leucine-rich repeat (LRR) protein